MVAGIDSENEGSLRFHARAGFLETGRMPEVGQMRGLWRNLVLLQKTLAPLTTAAPNDDRRNPPGPMNSRRKRSQ
jgi:hypothetical protein